MGLIGIIRSAHADNPIPHVLFGIKGSVQVQSDRLRERFASEQHARACLSNLKLSGKSPDLEAESAGCKRRSLAVPGTTKKPQGRVLRAARGVVEA